MIRERLYPSLHRELQTSLSPLAAEQALAKEVEPYRWFRLFAWRAKTFEGVVGDGAFDIQRIISYRNSFLPRIRGTIRASAPGSTISVDMSLSPFVLSFVAIFIFGAVVALFTPSTARGELGAIAILVFLWLMTLGGFHFEAAKAERALNRIFKTNRSGRSA